MFKNSSGILGDGYRTMSPQDNKMRLLCTKKTRKKVCMRIIISTHLHVDFSFSALSPQTFTVALPMNLIGRPSLLDPALALSRAALSQSRPSSISQQSRCKSRGAVSETFFADGDICLRACRATSIGF